MSTSEEDLVAEPWLEVRVLGPLRLRLADGTVRGEQHLRVTKNVELLRWLALAEGRVVAEDVLLDALWPGVDEGRARHSLRTAMSALRTVVGDHVRRAPGGVVLARAWVDAVAFHGLVADAARYHREARTLEALVTAREALALYLADVPTTTAPPPVLASAHALAEQRRRCLEDAAEAAAEGGWLHDAVDLGLQARAVAPLSERAARALMVGWSGLGESDRALAEYERCRRALDRELGALPSPQTRAVHLRVLDPVAPPRPPVPLVGRRDPLAWLGRLVRPPRGDVPTAPGPVPRVVVAGAEGSGRRAVVMAACSAAGRAVVEVGSPEELTAAADRHGVVLLWEPSGWHDRTLLEALLTDPVVLPHAAAVVLLAPCPDAAAADPAWAGLAFGDGVHAIELGPLHEDEVATLATTLLGAPVAPDLVAELVEETGSQPADLVRVTRRLATSGRLVVTSAGLARAPGPPGQGWGGTGAAVRALQTLDGDALEALLLTGVVGRPVTAAVLAPLLPSAGGGTSTRQRVARAGAALDDLVESSLLHLTHAGAEWRHPLVRDAVHAWLRPTERRRLHRRVAERAAVSHAERVQHWLAAQEPHLACSAALDAAHESGVRGDLLGAFRHLQQVEQLGGAVAEMGADGAEVLERTGDVCTGLRRLEEARSAYLRALAVAEQHLLPSAARLRRKAEGAAEPLALGSSHPGAAEAPVTALAGLSGLVERDPLLLAEVLDEAVRRAERRGDQPTAWRSRLLRAQAVHLPMRRFRDLHEDVEAVLRSRAAPADRLRATLVDCTTQVLLGRARAVRPRLEELARAGRGSGDTVLVVRTAAVRALAAHDLGEPGVDALVDELEERARAGTLDELSVEAAAFGLRLLVEREELPRAALMAQYLSSPGAAVHSPLLAQLAELGLAGLEEASGDARAAAERLRALVRDGRRSGCVLLVPEAAARLVALVAPVDLDEARSSFDLSDEVSRASRGEPREDVWRLVARGAVRWAVGDRGGADAACRQAADVASGAGLHVLAGAVRRECAARHRTDPGGRPGEDRRPRQPSGAERTSQGPVGGQSTRPSTAEDGTGPKSRLSTEDLRSSPRT